MDTELIVDRGMDYIVETCKELAKFVRCESSRYVTSV